MNILVGDHGSRQHERAGRSELLLNSMFTQTTEKHLHEPCADVSLFQASVQLDCSNTLCRPAYDFPAAVGFALRYYNASAVPRPH